MTDDVAARKAERVKALLAGYYGAGPPGEPGLANPSANAAASGGGSPEKRQGMGGAAGSGGGQAAFRRGGRAAMAAVTLDSPSFDASQHMAALLQVTSVASCMSSATLWCTVRTLVVGTEPLQSSSRATDATASQSSPPM
jgi:hypothetical protein